ncbi:MAG: MFS transporter [Zetaproteobacteria bacterium CG12_big_fil_rev_8_21_14_0_65_54_13]|nr:MAG: MFS transporter [Zetaproteobacteria bacterium CG12_big_fil_rev_8_21_14_0_65_54_13]PIX53662.1 MAG: MFS transporter [Zetaproteobacteria bacterium CG_4_10_14_3_um_filter_54_28]PJA27880.1 MAG: MFS transporter [Zetaproteobacteria bacterium CG_4_9_14_3_um_filter_54_145]
MVTAASLNHIRLFYAAYFAAMGLILPYFPMYLAQIGLGAVMIGVMTGLLAATKVIAPPLIGHRLDQQSAVFVRRFLITAAVIAATCALLLGLSQQLITIALATLLFGICWSVILPLTDGLSVSVSEAALADYGRLRVWGSLGFVVASLAGGIWLLGDGIVLNFPLALAGLLLVTAFAARGFPYLQASPPDQVAGHGAQPPFSKLFLLLLLIAFVMQLSHGAYYGFFSLYLADAGYSGWQIGAFWVVGVVAEIVLMWVWTKPLQQAAPAYVFAICMALAALRWLGTGLSTDAVWLFALQLLHAASFAAFHVAAIVWVKRLSPGTRHAAAQGWYSAAGFGLGNTLGIMGCGLLVEAYGFSPAFYICAVIALFGIPLSLLLPRVSRNQAGR